MSYTTDQIEKDINTSRHALNDTLDALGSKLSPGQMIDEVLGLAQGQAGAFAGKLGRQVRDNPLPTLLIGAGIAMLFLNRGNSGDAVDPNDLRSDAQYRRIEEARWQTARMAGETEDAYNERLHHAHASALDLKQHAGEAIDAFRARVGKAISATEEAAASARDRLKRTWSGAVHFAQDQAEHLGARATDAKHSAEQFYSDNPLVSGALAMAVGALIGGSAPLSGVERDALSGVADQATRAGANLAEKGARLVDDRIDAVH